MKALRELVESSDSLVQVILGAVRGPLLVLDTDLRILGASNSFHRLFQVDPGDTRNCTLPSLDGGAWNFPALHQLVQRVRSERAPIEGVEISHNFPRIGQRILLLDACSTYGSSDGQMTILLGIEDVTERRAVEEKKRWLQKQTDDLLEQRELMVREMQHRIINSLQIIASILMIKARAVTSEETRQHLQDAHRRVLSVAAVQQHLHTSLVAEQIDIAPYLQKLCASLIELMISESRPVALKVVSDDGTMTSAEAVSVGLIVTELVINALKYAFPDPDGSALITVRYEVNGTDWKLSVSDNGVGRAPGSGMRGKGGLGTSLVKALAHQLDAQVEFNDGPAGLSVAIAHVTFTSRSPVVAEESRNKIEA